MYETPKLIRDKAAPLVAFLCDYDIFQSLEVVWRSIFGKDPDFKPSHFNPSEFILPVRRERKTEPASMAPNGILKISWMTKHRYIVPCCAVFIVSLNEEELKRSVPSDEKLQSIHKIKHFAQTRDLSFVLCVTAENPACETAAQLPSAGSPPELRAKIWKKCSSLDSSDGFALLNMIPKYVNASLRYLNSVIVSAFSEKYASECARIRKLRDLLVRKEYNPLFIRFSFKLGYYAEFMGRYDAALKDFESGYDMVVQDMRNVDTVTVNIELKGIGGIFNYKITQLLLRSGRISEAISRFEKHITVFRQFVGPKADILYSHFEFLAMEHFNIFGLLMKNLKMGRSISPASPTHILSAGMQYLHDWYECSKNLLSNFKEKEESLEEMDKTYFCESPKSTQDHPLEDVDTSETEEESSYLVKLHTFKRNLANEIILQSEKLSKKMRSSNLKHGSLQMSLMLADAYRRYGKPEEALSLYYATYRSLKRLGWRSLVVHVLESLLAIHVDRNDIFSFVKDAAEYIPLLEDPTGAQFRAVQGLVQGFLRVKDVPASDTTILLAGREVEIGMDCTADSMVILSSLPIDYPLVGCNVQWSTNVAKPSALVGLTAEITSRMKKIADGTATQLPFPLTMLRIEFSSQKKGYLYVDEESVRSYVGNSFSFWAENEPITEGRLDFSRLLYRYANEDVVLRSSLGFAGKETVSRTLEVEMARDKDLLLESVFIQIGVLPSAIVLAFNMKENWSKLRFTSLFSPEKYMDMLMRLPLRDHQRSVAGRSVKMERALSITGTELSDGANAALLHPMNVCIEVPKVKADFKVLNDENELKAIIVNEVYLVEVEVTSFEEDLISPYLCVSELTGISKANSSLILFDKYDSQMKTNSELWVDYADMIPNERRVIGFYVKSKVSGQHKLIVRLGCVMKSGESVCEISLAIGFTNPFSAKVEFLPKEFLWNRTDSGRRKGSDNEVDSTFFTHTPYILRLNLYYNSNKSLKVVRARRCEDGNAEDYSKMLEEGIGDDFSDDEYRILNKNSKFTVYDSLRFEKAGRFNLGTYYFLLRRFRESDSRSDFKMFNIVEEVRLPAVGARQLAISSTPSYPPKVRLNEAFCVTFELRNYTSILQSVKLTTIPTDKFLFAGVKSVEMIIHPQKTTVVRVKLIPLVTGSMVLPSVKMVSQLTLEEVLETKRKLGIQIIP